MGQVSVTCNQEGKGGRGQEREGEGEGEKKTSKACIEIVVF